MVCRSRGIAGKKAGGRLVVVGGAGKKNGRRLRCRALLRAHRRTRGLASYDPHEIHTKAA